MNDGCDTTSLHRALHHLFSVGGSFALGLFFSATWKFGTAASFVFSFTPRALRLAIENSVVRRHYIALPSRHVPSMADT